MTGLLPESLRPDPLAGVRAGDPDPTPDGANWCDVEWSTPNHGTGTVACTREAGHPETWQHIAGDGTTAVAVLPPPAVVREEWDEEGPPIPPPHPAAPWDVVQEVADRIEALIPAGGRIPAELQRSWSSVIARHLAARGYITRPPAAP